jgi:hypothetical protein
MLGPVVLDTLGQQQRSAGLDTSGLANLLTAQKQQFAAALPAGFSEQLSAAGLGDILEGSLREGATAASAAAGRIGSTSREAMARAGQTASVARSAPAAQWPYWVLGLAALAGLAWLFLGNWSGQRVAEQTPPPAIPSTQSGEPRETVGLAPANLTVGGINLADQVTSSMDTLRTTLGGITDSASARAAVPKLHEVTAQLDKVNNMAAQLPKERRSALAALIAAAMPTINSAIEKILATPGIADVARPAINELRAKLDLLARA